MERAKKAEQYFLDGYACSQAVVLAFSDLVNVDKEELLKLSLPLGGGLGRLRLTCGAVTGMAVIAGLLFSKTEPSEESKIQAYSIIQELVKRFEELRGTINCKELLEKASLEVEVGGKPEERNDKYYKKRPCAKIVYQASLVLEEYLKEVGII